MLSLPFLETFATAKEAKAMAPKRMVFLGGGFGFTQETFYPTKSGKFSKIGLTEGLKPLENHKDDITMIGNLTNPKINDPHAGTSGYLSGDKFKVSCDQIAANQFGQFSRYASLVLTANGDKAGHGKGGISLSNNNEGKPIAGLKRPIDLYHTLFASGKESPGKLKKMLAEKRSILDVISENGNSMNKRLGKVDQERIEEYFQSVRDIENNLQRQAEWSKVPKPKASFKAPGQEVNGLDEIKLMLDMIVISLQTDSTRVATYRYPIESVLKSLEAGITAHAMSHYKFSESKRAASQKRDHAIMELLAYFIDRLKETKDRDGNSLYDSTIVSYGSNLRTGHDLRGCPAILTGGGAKNIKHGRHVMLPKLTPLSNLWLTLLTEAGVEVEQFGDSKGVLTEILS